MFIARAMIGSTKLGIFILDGVLDNSLFASCRFNPVFKKGKDTGGTGVDFRYASRLLFVSRPESKKRLAVLDGLAVFNVNANNLACDFRFNFVHQLHGLDNT